MAGALEKQIFASFHFEVNIKGFAPNDYSFKEVSGISMEREINEIKSGGLQYAYRVPGRIKYGELTLKRGVVMANSPLSKWCMSTIKSTLDKPIVPKSIIVKLMNAKGKPAVSWSFSNAWPKKWEVSNLNSMASGEASLLIETLTFVYESFKKV